MSAMTAVKERMQKWDILKLVLIFLVVLGHVAEPYLNNFHILKALWYWIYTFHMPLFIFVTGLFSKKNINEKRYNKIVSYFFIYVMTKVLGLLFGLMDGRVFHFSLFTEGGFAWYMLAVFEFSLITIVMKRFPKPYVFFFSILLGCVIGYDGSIGNFLALSRIIVYYPFFFAGYCLDAEKIVHFLSKTYVKVISAIYFLVYSAVILFKLDDIYFTRPLLSGKNPFSALGEYAEYGLLFRLGYYVLVFLFCASVIALIPNRLDKKGHIARLGSRTLQVYILHFAIIYFMRGYLDMEAIFGNTSYYLVIPISLLITWFFSLKFWEKPLGYLINPDTWKHLDSKRSS